MKLDIAYKSIPMPGQRHNGDAVMVRDEGERNLFAVIDGLGHGTKASEAAQRVVRLLEQVDLSDGIAAIMRFLNESMRGSRGAAATVCVVHEGVIEGCGIGNVEIRSRSARVPLMLTPGILGRTIRDIRCFRGPFGPGSRVAMFSDGLSARFALMEVDNLPPKPACEALLAHYGRGQDDTTVLVADVGGLCGTGR
jgi:phosphoserine phosphatase RsbX